MAFPPPQGSWSARFTPGIGTASHMMQLQDWCHGRVRGHTIGYDRYFVLAPILTKPGSGLPPIQLPAFVVLVWDFQLKSPCPNEQHVWWGRRGASLVGRGGARDHQDDPSVHAHCMYCSGSRQLTCLTFSQGNILTSMLYKVWLWLYPYS